jgi:hypothetical protein
MHGMLTSIPFGMFLPSRLLSENLKTEIYRAIILSSVLYGCET